MALVTTRLRGRIALPNDISVVNAKVTFTLSQFDTDAIEDATIPPASVDAQVISGNIDVYLWPNSRGVRGTVYNVVLLVATASGAERGYSLGSIIVPASGPVDLNDLLPLTPPAGVTASQYLATLSASASAAAASATAAAASANVAQNAVQATSAGTGRVSIGGTEINGTALTIADNQRIQYGLSRQGGFLFMTVGGSVGATTTIESASAILLFDLGTTRTMAKLDIAQGGSNISSLVDTSTDDLTGTTGADGRVTVSARPGNIHIENRLGGSAVFNLMVL